MFAIITVLFSIQFAIASPKTEYCKTAAQMAESIYEARAQGVPKATVIKAAISTMQNNPEALTLGLTLINEVYSMPSSYVIQGKGELLGSTVFNSCIGTTI